MPRSSPPDGMLHDSMAWRAWKAGTRAPGHPLAIARRRRESRHRRAIAYAVVASGWWLALYIGSGVLDAEPHRTFWLIIHLATLVVGLGAAVAVEYVGLLWVLGRSTVADVCATDRRFAFPAWAGFAGLLFSGAFLAPDLSNPATALKMLAVLIAGLNAVGASRLTGELHRLHPRLPWKRTPLRMRLWCLTNGSTSQIAWWSAVLIGALSTAGASAP